ncbi:MAG: aldo/keto reductase [Chitinispirillaceae bacterium]
MKYRKFGSTGYEVSEVGLGTWQFGGDWGEMAEETAHEILGSALDNGINFFDTADVYGGGRSESLIGDFLSPKDDRVYVATKLGRLEGYPDDYSLELLRRCTENSLKRLKRDSIDLTQLHCIPKKHLESGEVFDWLRELKKEGKIRQFGASVETIEEAMICLKQDDLASLQVIFNVFRQKAADELFPKAAEKGVALIIRLPLASGLLAGKYTKETTFAPSDHRTYNKDGEAFNVGETFSGLPFELGVEIADGLRPMVPDQMSMAQWALRWILDHPQVSTIIPGASKVAQVKSNADASELPALGDDVHAKLKSTYKESIEQKIRGQI